MEAIQGTDVILEFYKGSDYHPFVCAEDCAISFKASTLPSKTKGDGDWEDFIVDTKGYTISCNGLIPYDDAVNVSAFDMYDTFDQKVSIPFRIIFRDPASNLIKAFVGNALVEGIDFSAPIDWATASVSLRGRGRASLQNNLLLCQATIGSFIVSQQNELAVIFHYSGVTNSTRLEYSINGFSRSAKLINGSSGSFSVPKLVIGSAGDQSITVWPVCDSGESGEPITLDFTMT